jgi:hypothetical protein
VREHFAVRWRPVARPGPAQQANSPSTRANISRTSGSVASCACATVSQHSGAFGFSRANRTGFPEGYLDPLRPEEVFFGDLDGATTRAAVARLGHQSWLAINHPLTRAAHDPDRPRPDATSHLPVGRARM